MGFVKLAAIAICLRSLNRLPRPREIDAGLFDATQAMGAFDGMSLGPFTVGNIMALAR
jgi:hypothetical protein